MNAPHLNDVRRLGASLNIELTNRCQIMADATVDFLLI